MRTPISLENPGTFGMGCNYWASHAGTAMWSDWRPEIVESDFKKLSDHGVEWLRVFPLWPDFQPITQMRGQGGRPVEIRLGECPLPTDSIGQAGVSAVMLGRFIECCALAEKYGLKLIVGLITGWMSGRLFVPPALDALDPITDAKSIAWQIKMVRTIVTHARDQKAIAAWDLGNECNCMGKPASRDAAYLWTATITNAIRAADSSRPVVSGMHSLVSAIGAAPGSNEWTIDDQGELTDILTTHPYPYWVRHTRADAVNTLRTTLHATAETRFYSDIGGKPCFAEEIGTMGPMVAGDETSADFARVNLFSLWANDCRGFLWWCAHDQTDLAHAPYDWIGVETELGLLRNDGTAKPVLREMGGFRRFLESLPFKTLPRRPIDAICLLTKNQDDWAAAFGAFVLGKQAKLEIEFRHIHQAIPEANLYLLPSIQGPDCIPRRQWLELLDRVKAGATLYLSLGDGIVPHFNEVTGVELLSRAQAKSPLLAVLGGTEVLPMHDADDLRFECRDAEVLGVREDTGSPVFWHHALGKGRIFVYAAPLEVSLTRRAGVFDEGAPPYWHLYEAFCKNLPSSRLLEISSPALAITEHHLPDGRVAVIAINHTATPQEITSSLPDGVGLETVWRGAVSSDDSYHLKLIIPAFDAVVFACAPSQITETDKSKDPNPVGI